MTIICTETESDLHRYRCLIARFIERDQYHVQAVEVWRDLQIKRTCCLTSNFVLNETLTLLARRTTYQFAVNRARSLYASTVLQILAPLPTRMNLPRLAISISTPTNKSVSRIAFPLR